MSNSKNKAVIGAFVVGAVALAVVGVLVLGGGEFFKKKLTYVMYFDGSIKGLKVGSPVVFQGVDIGTVKEIAVRANIEDWTFKVPVVIDVDPGTYRDPNIEIDEKKSMSLLIEKGLRAKLELQSVVTGQLQVALDFMPDTKPRLVGTDLPYIEIPTTASGIEKFADTIKQLPLKEAIGNLSATLASIKEFVDNPAFKESVHNLNETILEIKNLVQHVDADVVGSAKQTVRHADRMLDNLDEGIIPLLSKADKTIEEMDKLVAHVDKIIKPIAADISGAVKNIKEASNTVGPAIKNVGQTFANIESMTRKNSKERERLDNVLKELSAAARSIKHWADYLERHPEALLRGKGNPRQRR